MSTNKTAPAADQAEFTNLVNLLSIGAEAHARLGELENTLQQAWIDMVDGLRKDYAELQATLATTEEAIRDAVDLNPQWFAKQRTLKTPYGQIAFRKSTKLLVKNEEATIILLEQLGPEAAVFIRERKELDLEALEKLPDEELERVRVKRQTTETMSVKYAKPDLGKAVAAAAKGGES